jgi:nicotine blue oxidoreductase
VLERVRASSVADVVVVLGAHDVETNARTVACADWERGPGASLRCGLGALGEDVDAAAIVLADGPRLSPLAIDRLIARRSERGSSYLAASYRGVRGHPVLLGRELWKAIPDEGLRSVVPELVPCDDLGEPGDVDYPDDLPAE